MKRIIVFVCLLVVQCSMLFGMRDHLRQMGIAEAKIKALESTGMTEDGWERLGGLGLTDEQLREFVVQARVRGRPLAVLEKLEEQAAAQAAPAEGAQQEAARAAAAEQVAREQRAQAEVDRVARERAEAERVRQARQEVERRARAQAEADARAERERRERADRAFALDLQQREQAEAERVARERMELERVAAEEQRKADAAAQARRDALRAQVEADARFAKEQADREQEKRKAAAAAEEKHKADEAARVEREKQEKARQDAEAEEAKQIEEAKQASLIDEQARQERVQKAEAAPKPAEEISRKEKEEQDRKAEKEQKEKREWVAGVAPVQQREEIPPSASPAMAASAAAGLSEQQWGGHEEADAELQRIIALSLAEAGGKREKEKKESIAAVRPVQRRKVTAKEKPDEERKESKEEAAIEQREQAIDKELMNAVDRLESLNAALTKQFTAFIDSLTVAVPIDRVVHGERRREPRCNYYKEVFEAVDGEYRVDVINSLVQKIQNSGQRDVNGNRLGVVVYLSLFMHVRLEYDRMIKKVYDDLDRRYTDTIYRILLNKRAVENEIKDAHDKGQEPQKRLTQRKNRLDGLLVTISQGHEACIVPIAQFKAAMVKRTLMGVKAEYDWGGGLRFDVSRGDLTVAETNRPLRGDQVFAKMQSGPAIYSQIAAMSDRDFYIPAVTQTLSISFTGEIGIDAGGLRREFVGLFLEPYLSAVEENKDEEGHDVISQWFFDHDKELTYALPKRLSELSAKAELKVPDDAAIAEARSTIAKLEQEEKELNAAIERIDGDASKSRPQKVMDTARLRNAFALKRKQLKDARDLLKVSEIKHENSALLDNYQTSYKALGRVLLLSLANNIPVVFPLPSSSFLTILEGTPSVSTIDRLHLLIRLLYEYSPDACGSFLDMIIEYEKAKRAGKSEAASVSALQTYAVEKGFLAEDVFQQGTPWWVVLNGEILKRLHVFDEDGKPSRSLRAMNDGLSIPQTLIIDERAIENVDASEKKLAAVAGFLVRDARLPQANLVHDLQVELLPEVICMPVGRVWSWLSPADCVYGLFASEIDAQAVKKGLRRDGNLNPHQNIAANLFMEAVGEYLDDNTKRVDEKTSEDLDSPEERMRKQRALGDFVQFLCGARAYDGRALKFNFCRGENRRAAYDAHSCFGSVDIFIDTVIDQLAPHRKDSSALDALPVPKLETLDDKKSFKEAVKANIAQYWKGDFYSHG